MSASSLPPAHNTAVLFIVFNRPSTTKIVFEAIRRAKPSRLYIAADAPRPTVISDMAQCLEVQRIVNEVDWNCDVKRLIRNENLGCGKGVSSAITWFFQHEEEGIILEDDCLPSASFFPFCTELLDRYRDDTRVMHIGGNNLEKKKLRAEDYSYRFSSHVYVWGWATWRRAWKLHDLDMNFHPEITDKGYLNGVFDTIYERDYFQYVFEKMHKGDARTNSKTIWDFQWQFACMINSGLVIVPNSNLVANIGFGVQATNLSNPHGPGHDLKVEEMNFPLTHPPFVMVDQVRDQAVFKQVSTTMSSRVKSHVKNILPDRVVKELVQPLMSLLSLKKYQLYIKRTSSIFNL